MEPLEGRQLLSTYYVSASGHDNGSGTSAGSAWHSIERVNKQTLKAGDKVLFQGGKSFSGGLKLDSKESGSAKNQIVFSSYGSGRATINSGSKYGFDIALANGIAISNLKFVGSGMYKNSAWGIYVHNDHSNRTMSSYHIKNVEVTGYGREGIRFVVSANNSAINDVRVEYTDVHDNLWGGLKANNDRISGSKNYVVDHVRAWNNFGSKSASGVTGNGIFLEGIAGGTITRSIAHDNGKDGKAPVGIWAAMGERYVIQYCESYNNRTANTSDGGGFDFDWDVKNSVMQYNYSHGNDGPGYILAAGFHYNTGNTIRYNVSENDGRKNGRSGIQVWGNVRDSLIHNNTVYMSPTGNDLSAAFIAHDGGSHGKQPWNVLVRNNIFYVTGGVRLVRVTDGVVKKGALKFTGNNFFANDGKFRVSWAGKEYKGIVDWRAKTGQEKANGRATGYQTNPRLRNPGHGGTIGNADKLDTLTAYRLSSKSKMANRGLAIPTFLSEIVNHDFFGKKLHGRVDIGANEIA